MGSGKRPAATGLVLTVVVLGQIIMGGTFPAAKVALYDFGAFTLALFRYVIAAGALLAVVCLTGRARKIDRADLPKLFLLGLLAIPLNQLLFLYGLQFTTPARSAIYFGATPIFVFLLAIPLLHEKATVAKLVGALVSFVGVTLVVLGGKTGGESSIVGDLLVLTAVAGWSTYTVVGKPMVRKYGPLAMTAYALSIGTLCYLPFGLYLARDFQPSQVSLGGWLGLLYIALFTSVLGYTLWYWALNRMEAGKLAIFENIQPIAAAILSVFIIGETLGLWFFAGGLLVIAGVVLTHRS